MELIDHRLPAPQIPVEIRGRFADRLHSNAAAFLAAVAVGNFQRTERSGLNRFAQPGNASVAATLRSGAGLQLQIPLCRHSNASLAHIVAHRLFDVHMFARLSRPDGDQRMPVIGVGD